MDKPNNQPITPSDLEPGIIVTHIKSGRTYEVMHMAIDATNSRPGQRCVVYRQGGTGEEVFSREVGEFCEKFEMKMAAAC